MVRFLRDICTIVGLGFLVTIFFYPQLVPPTVVFLNSYWSRAVNLSQLVTEEWNRGQRKP
jgi:hypothetical protein